MGAATKAAERTKAAAAAAQQGNGQVEVAQPTVQQTIEQLKPQIMRALPKGMTADRFTRIVLTTLRTTPKLMECNPQSLLAAVMLSAQLGLEPGPLGHAYFVPYGREVTFIVGYKGIIDLARRSGQIKSIEAREVCENDLFEYEFGLDPKLRHVPAMGDRGAPKLYYGVAHFVDGGHYFEVMSLADIEKFRARSKAKDNGPWKTDYSAMAKKTVIRRMAPFLPVSSETARAIEADEGIVVDLPLEGPGDDGAPTVEVQAVEHEDDAPPAPKPAGKSAAAAEQQTLGDEQRDDVCQVCGVVGEDKHDEQAHVAFDAAEREQS